MGTTMPYAHRGATGGVGDPHTRPWARRAHDPVSPVLSGLTQRQRTVRTPYRSVPGDPIPRRNDPMSDYANPDVLVSTDWLEAHLDDAGTRVIEVDEDTSAYEKGHIKGAVGWNWTTDLHTKVGRDYLDQGGFAELLA